MFIQFICAFLALTQGLAYTPRLQSSVRTSESLPFFSHSKGQALNACRDIRGITELMGDQSQDLSPVRGMVLAEGFGLWNLRFVFGNYGPKREGSFCWEKTRVGDTLTQNKDCPQDAFSELVQFLFPSHVRGEISIHPLPSDIGYHLDPMTLGQLVALLKTSQEGSDSQLGNSKLSGSELGSQLKEILQDAGGKKWKNRTVDRLVDLILESRKSEKVLAQQAILPIFLAYAWVKHFNADSESSKKNMVLFLVGLGAIPHTSLSRHPDLDETYLNLKNPLLLKDFPEIEFRKFFQAHFSDSDLEEFRKNPDLAENQDQEKLAFLATAEKKRELGKLALPELIGYSQAFHSSLKNQISDKYSDCVETTLRNFWNLILFNSTSKQFDTEILEELRKQTPNLEFSPQLIRFFNTHKDPSKITSQQSRDDWSEWVVSSLPRVAYGKGVCDIKSNIDNILTVFENLIFYNRGSTFLTQTHLSKMDRLSKLLDLVSRPELEVKLNQRQKILNPDKETFSLIFKSPEKRMQQVYIWYINLNHSDLILAPHPLQRDTAVYERIIENILYQKDPRDILSGFGSELLALTAAESASVEVANSRSTRSFSAAILLGADLRSAEKILTALKESNIEDPYVQELAKNLFKILPLNDEYTQSRLANWAIEKLDFLSLDEQLDFLGPAMTRPYLVRKLEKSVEKGDLASLQNLFFKYPTLASMRLFKPNPYAHSDLLRYAIVKNASVEVVSFLLNQGLDPNAVSRQWLPPLIQDLLGEETGPVSAASKKRVTEILELLLAKGAYFGTIRGFHARIIMLSAYRYGYDVIKRILEGGLNLNQEECEVLYDFIKEYYQSDEQDLKTVKLLLDSGVDVNGRGFELETPIIAAVLPRHQDNNLELIRFLIQNGANVNHRSLFNGNTPLHKALQSKAWKSVSLLLESGAKIRSKDWIFMPEFRWNQLIRSF